MPPTMCRIISSGSNNATDVMKTDKTPKQYLKNVVIVLLFLAGGIALSVLLQNLGGKTAYLAPPAKGYQRIICMSPAVTETLYALDCGDLVVGVSSFSDFPAEAAKKPSVGGYINPNFERLLTLQGDLVIVQGRQEKVSDFCRQKNIPLLRVTFKDLAAIYQDIRTLGSELDRQGEAAALCDRIRQEIQDVQTRVAGCDRPRVFFSLYRAPGSLAGLSTVGGNTFLDELIEIAGGRNIFNDVVNDDYPQISKETLLKRQPQIIIEPVAADKLTDQQRSVRWADWRRLGNIPAVADGRIFFPTSDTLLKPGPRMGQAAQCLAELIHPEVDDE